MAKKKKINVEEIVAEVLTAFIFCKSMEEVQNTIKNIYNEFDLCEDPFTHLPCSFETYCKNREEYEKQLMIEKYGHCDGLE